MKSLLKTTLALCAGLFMSACSVFGDSGVAIAPYAVLETHDDIEIRHYERMILVSAPMPGGMDSSQREPFGRLFDYISGKNSGDQKIAMTAPVLMNGDSQAPPQGTEIPMTAPVFIGNDSKTMSFVMPESFTLATTPKPLDPDVTLQEIEDYTLAAIQFSGFLSESSVQNNLAKLESWIENSAYKKTGPHLTAGYNPPWTLPFFRRNEVLIPVAKK